MFVYLIPVLILFGVSPVAGLIAVVIYAMPPVVRLTNLDRWCRSRLSRPATHLARPISSACSAADPLALPNVFAGINQTIMMALAMVDRRTGRCAGSGGRSPLGTGHGKPALGPSRVLPSH